LGNLSVFRKMEARLILRQAQDDDFI